MFAQFIQWAILTREEWEPSWNLGSHVPAKGPLSKQAFLKRAVSGWLWYLFPVQLL